MVINMNRFAAATVLAVSVAVFTASCFAVSPAGTDSAETVPQEPEDIAVFRAAYPDVAFDSVYDSDNDYWRITVSVNEETAPDSGPDAPRRTAVRYWAGGRMLPREQLADKDRYWVLLYRYADKLADPADFTDEEIERIRGFSSAENRQNGAGSPQFFFDAIYDSATRASVEQHIVSVRFLGKTARVHERLRQPLARTEQRITALAEADAEVRSFVDTLAQADGYFWREIRDTSRRSFHSLGLAIDILPVNWGQKVLYWNWQKQKDPDNWMLTPLSERWMPPESVIRIFEDEGFIWGGKWSIWDNMHFEYHPELIAYLRKNSSGV